MTKPRAAEHRHHCVEPGCGGTAPCDGPCLLEHEPLPCDAHRGVRPCDWCGSRDGIMGESDEGLWMHGRCVGEMRARDRRPEAA